MKLAYERRNGVANFSYCPRHGHAIDGFKVDYHYSPFFGAGLMSYQYCRECTFMGPVSLFEAYIDESEAR